MRFEPVDAKEATMPVDRLRRALGVGVSAHYARKSRRASRCRTDDAVPLAHVRGHFARSNETYGGPRMHAEPKAEGVEVGRHRVARPTRRNGLRARRKRRYKTTTDSRRGGPVAPDPLDRDFAATGPNRKWGADIS